MNRIPEANSLPLPGAAHCTVARDVLERLTDAPIVVRPYPEQLNYERCRIVAERIVKKSIDLCSACQEGAAIDSKPCPKQDIIQNAEHLYQNGSLTDNI